MNKTVHISLRVPEDLHQEIMNTNEHTSRNAKYVARLRRDTAVLQTNTDDEVLEDIKAGVEEILNIIQQ